MYVQACFVWEAKIQDKIKRGVVTLGDEWYNINLEDSTVMKENDEVSARRIPLLQIKKKLLQKQEELSVICNQPDVYLDTLESEEVRCRLATCIFRSMWHHQSAAGETEAHELPVLLQKWHDHATVGGHGHFCYA